MFSISFLLKVIFDKGNPGYKAPIDFKLIPEGESNAESLRKIFHFL